MINLAVINLKSVLRRMVKIIIITLIVTMIIKFVQVFNFKTQIEILTSRMVSNHIEIIGSNISISNYLNKKETKKTINFKKLLATELAVFSTEELMERESEEENIDFIEICEDNSETKNLNEVIAIPINQKTYIIEENNRGERYTNNYGSVKINNESSYNLTHEMVNPNIDFRNKKDIIIYHTHTCESYTATEENYYEEQNKYRTTNLDYNITRVGKELTDILILKEYNVIHDKTIHDSPAFSGSYTRSLNTVNNLLSKTKAELVLDIHRDALGNNSKYAPSVKIGDETVAQIMFVIGTNGGGLEHKNWNTNLKLAIKIQEKANEMYPGLFKPIILRDSRYNQHVAEGAAIIEVGATGNTLEQCIGSMKYLANVISEVVK